MKQIVFLLFFLPLFCESQGFTFEGSISFPPNAPDSFPPNSHLILKLLDTSMADGPSYTYADSEISLEGYKKGQPLEYSISLPSTTNSGSKSCAKVEDCNDGEMCETHPTIRCIAPPCTFCQARMPMPGTTVSVSAVLNTGWDARIVKDEWIRDGDMHTDTAYDVRLPPDGTQEVYKQDISLVWHPLDWQYNAAQYDHPESSIKNTIHTPSSNQGSDNHGNNLETGSGGTGNSTNTQSSGLAVYTLIVISTLLFVLERFYS